MRNIPNRIKTQITKRKCFLEYDIQIHSTLYYYTELDCISPPYTIP
jgi:hypothetical protein